VPPLSNNVEEVVPITPIPHHNLQYAPLRIVGCTQVAFGSIQLATAFQQRLSPV